MDLSIIGGDGLFGFKRDRGELRDLLSDFDIELWDGSELGPLRGSYTTPFFFPLLAGIEFEV